MGNLWEGAVASEPQSHEGKDPLYGDSEGLRKKKQRAVWHLSGSQPGKSVLAGLFSFVGTASSGGWRLLRIPYIYRVCPSCTASRVMTDTRSDSHAENGNPVLIRGKPSRGSFKGL